VDRFRLHRHESEAFRGFTAHLPHLIALVYYEQTNGLRCTIGFAPRTFEQSLTDMTCAPLSLWRAEESGFSKSESGSDDHGETLVVALSDSTFIEAVLLNGALIRARILFVETLATNNANTSRAISCN